jgi:alginate O-acetyltransferase complex protein AlgI
VAVAFPFESYAFFFDLLALLLVLFPAYFLLKTERARRILMILAGIYLIYFIAPRLVLFYFIFWSVTFYAHRAAFMEAKSKRHEFLVALGYVGMLGIVLPMLAWKIDSPDFISFFTDWSNRALQHLSTKLWEIDLVKPLMAPIGISFATFRAVDLLIKTYLGKIEGLTYDQVLFYGFFPPVQVIGPIIEYEEVADQMRKPTPAEFIDGLIRTSLGAVKVFVLAAVLQQNEKIFEAPHDGPVWMLWLRLVGYSWYFYLNFSGYSDMAIGISGLFGFQLKENFNFPFFRRNIQEFWGSWHMGLTRWAQRNIFVPAGGYRAHTQYRALFLTMMAIALWHNLNISMLVFGVYHFGAQMVYRHHAARHAAKSVATSGHAAPPLPLWQQAGYGLLTYLTVLVSFPLISADFGKALVFYKALVGM